MKRRVFGTFCLVLGVILVLLSLASVGWILWNEERAGENAEDAMEQLLLQLEKQPVETTEPAHGELPTVAPVPGETVIAAPEELRAMPEVVIDGVSYIGYLHIPAIDLELPVIGESNPDNLEIAPCRFYGTVYQKNFVIGGHRYRKHFRKLKTLGYGEKVTFIDMEENVYTYEVADCEVIQPYEAEYLCSGNWDLSLYTCTPGGLTRVVLRCLRTA